MSAPALPRWRRSVAARFGCIALAMLPVLVVHALVLDAQLLMRLGMLVIVGVAVAFALLFALRQYDWGRGSYPALLDAFIQAALLAALWPSTTALWPATIALAFALIAQRLLGGWSTNPFPPPVLALAVAIALARSLSDADFTAPLVSLFDAGIVAAAWLGAVAVLLLLRLFPARAPLAFAMPVALVCGSGGVSATSFVVATVVAFALADTRHLPATRSGQVLVGALAGLGTAALWLDGAPPVAIAFPTLLAVALAPWIERLTLPRAKPVT